MTRLSGVFLISFSASFVGCMDDTHQGISPDYLKTAKLLQSPLVGYVDAINAVPVKGGRAVQVRGETATVEVQGWAVDMAAERPGQIMGMLVNEKPTSCQYGEDRPDVGIALNNENYRFSGYTCQIATSVFNQGDNSVEPILLTRAGTYYKGQKIVVTIGGSSKSP